jgi:hypothetical protein
VGETKRCRHRHFWAFKAIGVQLPMLWCYQCGAIKNGEDQWVRPTGVNGENPAMKEAHS